MFSFNNVRVISWNCCLPPWSVTRRKRLPHIVSFLLKQKPDVICLQEVFFTRDAEFITNALSDRGLAYSFHQKDLLILSRLPLTESVGYKFESQGSLFSLAFFDKLYGKGFQVVNIKKDDKFITIANTHLLSAYALDAEVYQKVRLEQVNEITHALTRFNYPKIITGDFNFQPHTNPYNLMLDKGYRDIFYSTAENTLKKRRLDYIFSSELIIPKHPKLVEPEDVSDHKILLSVWDV